MLQTHLFKMLIDKLSVILLLNAIKDLGYGNKE